VAAFYLTQAGAKVIAIIDRVGGLINEDGFTFEEVRELFINRKGNTLVSEHLISFEEINAKVWDLHAEIFIPAAASRLVTKDQVERMKKAGMEVIACGANVPFADPEIFFGPTGEYADENLSLIPDFISNCGMARVFAYLMNKGVLMSDEAIFEDTSIIIRNAIEKTFAHNNSKTQIAKTSFEIALKQLV
jgi:glutamate dehydrogenase/leucine dehydrogenase